MWRKIQKTDDGEFVDLNCFNAVNSYNLHSNLRIDPSKPDRVYYSNDCGLFSIEEPFEVNDGKVVATIEEIDFESVIQATNITGIVYGETDHIIDGVQTDEIASILIDVDAAGRLHILVAAVELPLTLITQNQTSYYIYAYSEDAGTTWQGVDVIYANNAHGIPDTNNTVSTYGLRDRGFCVSPNNLGVYYLPGRFGTFKASLNPVTNQTIFSSILGFNVHVDPREMIVYQGGAVGSPNDDVLFLCTDGGIQKSSSLVDDNGTPGNTNDDIDIPFGWTPLNGVGLNITEFRGLGLTEADKDLYVAGSFDGNMNLLNKNGWIQTEPGGDNFDCLVGQSYDANNNIVFHQQANSGYVVNLYNSSTNELGALLKNKNPYGTDVIKEFAMAMDPNDDSRIFLGYDELYKYDVNNSSLDPVVVNNTAVNTNQDCANQYYYTSDELGNAINNVSVSKSNSNVIYYSRQGRYYRGSGANAACSFLSNNEGEHSALPTKDIGGGIFRLNYDAQGNNTVTDISANLVSFRTNFPNECIIDDASAPLFNGAITGIAVHPEDENKVWIIFGGFYPVSPYDPAFDCIGAEDLSGSSRVYKTENANDPSGNVIWEPADPNWDKPFNSTTHCRIPNFPATSIVYEEGSDDRLYVGTDVGVFYTDNSMDHWARYGSDDINDGKLASVRIDDLEIRYCDRKLVAATIFRGLWEIPLPDEGSEIIVDQNQTWDTGRRINAKKIVVKSGTELVIGDANGAHSTFFMTKNCEIIVERDARLIIENATLTNSCGERWGSIQVFGNDFLEHYYGADFSNADANHYAQVPLYANAHNHGILIIRDNSVIENGINSTITNQRNVGNYLDPTTVGGIIIAENSTFRNNRKSIGFMKFDKENVSYFKNCTFEFTNDYDNAGHQVTMWNNTGVEFIDCIFRMNWDNAERLQQNPLGQYSALGTAAIYSVDAKFKVDNCMFDNFQYGVYLNNPSSGTPFTNDEIEITNSTFNANHYGLIGTNTEQMIIDNNTFNPNMDYITQISAPFWGTSTPTSQAVIIEGQATHDIDILNNSFSAKNANSVLETTTMYIDQTDLGSVFCARNDLDITDYGVKIIGGNDGSIFECNQFNTELYDFDFWSNSSIHATQGSQSTPAGNRFTDESLTQGCSKHFNAINAANVADIEYFHDPNPTDNRLIPTCYATMSNMVSLNSSSEENNCGYNTPGDIPPPDEIGLPATGGGGKSWGQPVCGSRACLVELQEDIKQFVSS